jgi:hypothetical protein
VKDQGGEGISMKKVDAIGVVLIKVAPVLYKEFYIIFGDKFTVLP